MNEFGFLPSIGSKLWKILNHSQPDNSLSYRFQVSIVVNGAFFQRKAEDEIEIWSDTFGYMYYKGVQVEVSECISLCLDEFNDIAPHEKRSWILHEHLFVK